MHAKAHGVHLSHGAPGNRTGSADSLTVHGLRIAVGLAARGELRVPVAAVFPFAEAA